MSDRLTSTANDIEYVNCPVCETDDHVVWMEDGKPTRYVRCRTCRTVYASPRLAFAKRFDWLNKTFALGPNALTNAANRKPTLVQEAEFIQRFISRGRILDIGCDLGDFFQQFHGPEWQRFGVELSPSAAAYANKTYNAQVFTGTVHQATFPDAFFDLVTMIDMLYYVDDPRADLKEVSRIIKPGGLLAIELAGQAYQLLRSRGVLCWFLDHRWTRLHTDSSYLYWFNTDGLKKLLGDCGFKVTVAHVVGSPTSSSLIRNYMARTYRTFINVVTHMSHWWLTLAPKYLLLAQSIK